MKISKRLLPLLALCTSLLTPLFCQEPQVEAVIEVETVIEDRTRGKERKPL